MDLGKAVQILHEAQEPHRTQNPCNTNANGPSQSKPETVSAGEIAERGSFVDLGDVRDPRTDRKHGSVSANVSRFQVKIGGKPRTACVPAWPELHVFSVLCARQLVVQPRITILLHLQETPSTFNSTKPSGGGGDGSNIRVCSGRRSLAFERDRGLSANHRRQKKLVGGKSLTPLQTLVDARCDKPAVPFLTYLCIACSTLWS